jgi:Leucine-rich repeat (LRR) protein
MALWDFYNSTHGDYWLWKLPLYGRPWNFSQGPDAPCQKFIFESWQGLECSCPINNQEYCTTSKLILPQFNLTGTLPDSLGYLSNLIEIQFIANHLLGTIPEYLGNLTNIGNLVLQNNDFTGTIPASLGNLVNLNLLYLQYNMLTGTIPSELGNLRNVTNIDLDTN